MKHLPKDPLEFLEKMDDLQGVTIDSLKNLVENWPSESKKTLEDLEILSKKNPTAQWNEAESYFLKLANKSCILIRLELWIYMTQFKKDLDMVSSDL